MNPDPTPIPDPALDELVAIGMRGARVVVCLMEIEQAAAQVVAGGLPKAGAEPASLSEAQTFGLSLDAVAEVMAAAVPRVAKLAHALERVSRLVRRAVALRQRMQAGWPRARMADDRPAMVRRQVKRGVAEVIRRVSDSEETAERLFDDLYDRLEDPALEQALLDWPVVEIVRQICRELGLGTGELRKVGGDAVPGADASRGERPPRATHGPPG